MRFSLFLTCATLLLSLQLEYVSASEAKRWKYRRGTIHEPSCAFIGQTTAAWLKDAGTAPASLVGGLALVWTYWGANYIQKGLHSYAGSGADKPTWPIYYGGIELLCFIVALVVFKRRQTYYREFPDAAPKATTPPDGLMTIAD